MPTVREKDRIAVSLAFVIEHFLSYKTSPNMRLYHHSLARQRRLLKAAAYSAAYNARRELEDKGEQFPWKRVVVQYTILYPPKTPPNKLPDRDNVIAAAKPALDSLCVCRANRGGVGVILDDGPGVVQDTPVFYVPDANWRAIALEILVDRRDA